MTYDSLPKPASGNLRINSGVPYILYGAFVFSCLLYGGLIASGVLRNAAEAIALELPVPLFLIFGLLALSHLPLAFVVGRTIALDGETDAFRLFQGIIRKLVIQCAFFEAIAIYGLVGYILGMETIPSLMLVGFGLACLITLMPGLQSQIDRLNRLMKNPQT